MFGKREMGLTKYEEILNTLRYGGTYPWIDWELNNVDMEWLEEVYKGLKKRGWATYNKGSERINKIFDECGFPHCELQRGYFFSSGYIVFLDKGVEREIRADFRRFG